jgi:phosphoribosyl-AMP cyclohydrolase
MGPVLVSNDRQLFGSAYLPSRSQKQFVVHRPRRSLGRLRILPRATPAVTPRISSEFDFDLFNVVVHDRDGNYWSTPKIDARSEGVSCNRSSSSAASKALGKLYNDHRPVSATREVNQGSYSSRTRDLISILNRSTGDQGRVVTDGVFELWLQQQLSIKGELPKGYFVALAKVSEDVVWVKGAENVASVRYVVGTLP